VSASNLRAERIRRVRCWESSVFVVGGGHGYVIVEIMVHDIVRGANGRLVDGSMKGNQRSKSTHSVL